MKKKASFSITFLMTLFTVACIFMTGCHWFKPQVEEPRADFHAETLVNRDVVIYFSKSRGTEVVTEGVTRTVPQAYSGDKLAFAVNELLKGPTPQEKAQGFFSEMPAGTRLIQVARQGKTIHVNLSDKFTSGGGSTSMQQRLEELTKTIQYQEKKIPVDVDINGHPLKVLGGEGLEVPQPVNKSERVQ